MFHSIRNTARYPSLSVRRDMEAKYDQCLHQREMCITSLVSTSVVVCRLSIILLSECADWFLGTKGSCCASTIPFVAPCFYCRRGYGHNTEIILGMGPANEKRRYKVTSSFIDWTHTQNDLCNSSWPKRITGSLTEFHKMSLFACRETVPVDGKLPVYVSCTQEFPKHAATRFVFE